VKFDVKIESWPIAGSFTISRGSKTTAEVVVVSLEKDGAIGRGEGVPYARYSETTSGSLEALSAGRKKIESGISRQEVSDLKLPKSAANALDCALWDIEAKLSGVPVWQRAGLAKPNPIETAYTLSLNSPSEMATQAAANRHRPVLKLKLGQQGDTERLRLIRLAAPTSKLIVDANEGWNSDILEEMLDACEKASVSLVEQPLPAGHDESLRDLKPKILICADESVHGIESLDGLLGKYNAINIKLDKTGGLTGALALAKQARAMDMKIMVGCMLATSLSMAPALLLAQNAEFVDLDGPLLLAQDREPGLNYAGSKVFPARPELWG
jgi:L-Ala-D/L-Glu epimerase